MTSQVIGQAGFSCMLESDLSGADGPFDFPILTHKVGCLTGEPAGIRDGRDGRVDHSHQIRRAFLMLTCGQSPEKC